MQHIKTMFAGDKGRGTDRRFERAACHQWADRGSTRLRTWQNTGQDVRCRPELLISSFSIV